MFALKVTAVSSGVAGGVSAGDVSMCTSRAFKGTWSGVGGGVPIRLVSGRGSKGEQGGVLIQGLQRGLSISAEAIRVRLQGTLD